MMVDLQVGENVKVVVQKVEFKGKQRLDIRHYFVPKNSDKWHPTKKGVSISIDEVDNFIDALDKVLKET